jgi:hypothetical protein
MFWRLPAKKLTSRRLPFSVPGTSLNTKHGASSAWADISATMPMSRVGLFEPLAQIVIG